MADTITIVQGVSYEDLVTRVLDFVASAAIARADDDFTWEQEVVLRTGLDSIDFFADGKAIWTDPECFGSELEGARAAGVEERFLAENELDNQFLTRLDADLRQRLSRAGYAVDSMLTSMKDLYREIASEIRERSGEARERLKAEILLS